MTERTTNRVREADTIERRWLQEKLRDPKYLASRDEVSRAFDGASDGFFNDEWRDFCSAKEGEWIYEFLTEEYVGALAAYISSRANQLGASPKNPLTILEAGAGNGRLTHFLQEKLEAGAPGQLNVIATDSGEWELKPVFPVEKIDHKEALLKYRPAIVLFSWMPYEVDLTAEFRAERSVEEYILIGESNGCCGAEWETWGRFSGLEDDDEYAEREKMLPPFEADGFEMEYVEDLSEIQVCRTDRPPRCYHSSTVSFKRKKSI